MMRVLSPIYPADVLPVRDGWYLMSLPYSQLFVLREFRDGSWRYPSGDSFDDFDNGRWRGLAFDPAGAFDDDSWNWKEPGNIESGGYEQGVFVPGATCE